MAFSTSAALLTLVAIVSSRNINVSDKCSSESDKTSIGRCVRPWLDLWELQRKHETTSADLVFPLVFYSRESVLALCDLYTKSREDCLSDSVLKTCANDPMISFVQSHMKYFCGEKTVPPLSRFDCLMKAVKNNPACREHIRGIPLPNHQASKCLGMPQFYRCIEPEIDERCGAPGLAIMVQAIDAFGCKFADPGSEKSGEVQVKLRKPAKAPSARPPKARSDVVIALEQSNSTEAPISVTELSDSSETTSPPAPLTEPVSRGPGLILISSSAEDVTSPNDGPATKLRDLAPKRPTTRGPGLIMLPRDALFASWRAVAIAGQDSAEHLNGRAYALTLEPTTTAAGVNQSHSTATTDLNSTEANDLSSTTTNDLSSTTANDLSSTTATDLSSTTTNDLSSTAATDLSSTPVNDLSSESTVDLPIPDARAQIQPIIDDSSFNNLIDSNEAGSGIPDLDVDYESIPWNDTVAVHGTRLIELSANETISLAALYGNFTDNNNIALQTANQSLAVNPFEGSGEEETVEEIPSTNITENATEHAAKNATIPGLIQLPDEDLQNIEGSGEAIQTNASSVSNGSGLVLLPVESNSSVQAVNESATEVVPEGSGEEGSGEEIGSGEELEGSGEQVDSDSSHVNLTRTIGSLDKKRPTKAPIPSKTNASENASNSFCDKDKQAKIGNCFLPLSKRWEGINQMHPDLAEVMFPLYNYSTSELLGLCEVLQVTIDDCLSNDLLVSCSENELITYVNSILGFACSREQHTDFFMNFDCTAMVMQENQHCFELIPGKHLPGISVEEKCANMPDFYSCMEQQVTDRCSVEAQQMFLRTIVNFGCDVARPPKKSKSKNDVDILPVEDNELENKVIDAPIALPTLATTVSANVESNTTSDPSVVVSTTGSTVEKVGANNVEDSSARSVTLSPDCTSEFRTKARDCVEPLMVTWTRIRTNKPQLRNITFPLYKYQREEILELCDGYANVFLCAGFDPIQKCLTDEMVRFANDHLGYICSPQNIVNFMRHYDCIMDLVGRSQTTCVPHISGSSEVGKDANKCKGVPDFHGCMKDVIELNCRPTALQEFDGTISQFGCELS